jgi:glutamine---fructose-6-phosphate transaminase (isomerizing)
MCGITAYIGKYDAFKYLMEGLIIMRNRGYDSAGIATFSKELQEFIISKFANDAGTTNSLEKIQNQANNHKGNTLGLGHTRWATHGSKSDENSHPHMDYYREVILVHNGIIENYQELKEFLLSENYQFLSETDTEVIVNLISYYYRLGSYPEEAIFKACQRMEGTWGLAIIFKKDPNHIYVSRNGSPILIGYNENMTIVSSEAAAFSNNVNQYIIIKDREIIKVGIQNSLQKKTLAEKYHVQSINLEQKIALKPDPYSHWMLKEIMEQPQSIIRALNNGGRIENDSKVRLGGLSNNMKDLLKIKHLLIIAMGTSLHAAYLGAKYFQMLKSVDVVTVIDASEFTESDIPCISEGVGALFLSQSGETKDVHLALELAKKHDLVVFSIVNVVDSLIARESDCGVYLNAGREVAVASTKSFTSQVVVMLLVAIWYAGERGVSKNLRHKLIQELHNLSYNFQETINSLERESVKYNELVEMLKDQHRLFLLGRQMGMPIALEGALKIKEVSYLHAEGYSGGALKHGPFALIEIGTPVIILAYRDEYRAKMHITAEEVRARGARVILITDLLEEEIPKGVYEGVFRVNHSGYLSSLLSIIPLQYLAYRLSVELGYNPDFPKNLAKSVTVD